MGTIHRQPVYLYLYPLALEEVIWLPQSTKASYEILPMEFCQTMSPVSTFLRPDRDVGSPLIGFMSRQRDGSGSTEHDRDASTQRRRDKAKAKEDEKLEKRRLKEEERQKKEKEREKKRDSKQNKKEKPFPR